MVTWIEDNPGNPESDEEPDSHNLSPDDKWADSWALENEIQGRPRLAFPGAGAAGATELE